MATWSRWRLLFVFAFIYFCDAHILPYSEFDSATVLHDSANSNNARELFIEIHGHNFVNTHMQIRLTANPSTCDNENNNNVKVRETVVKSPSVVQSVITVVDDVNVGVLYFCIREKVATYGGEIFEWRHAGNNVFLTLYPRTENRVKLEEFGPNRIKIRRDAEQALRVTGIRVEHADKDPLLSESGNGVPVILTDVEAIVRLFGTGITSHTWVTFTQRIGLYGGSCQLTSGGQYQVEQTAEDLQASTGRITVKLPLSPENTPFYVCAKTRKTDSTEDVTANEAVPFVHQGSEPWLQIRTYKKFLPIAVSIVIIIVCLSFSALFSGLNLGLMSLDRTELKILCNTGNESEKKYARIIKPVRDHGNFLLCSILLGNVLVNSIFTILLDDLTSGLIAIVFSTLAIVMFGEISPQALCSRHGLAVGARTIYITKAVMCITSPLSYPISKILDVILGEEIGNVYNRERLKELVKVTTDINDLDKDEVNIISGALELRKKTVADVMTRIEDVFMLDYEAVLDFETVSEIMKTGFSRVPVFEGNRNNIITVLYIKDLAFVDPDDNTPLKTLCQFYQNPCNFVFEDQKLDVMFRQFKEGNKGHMAFVNRVNNEGDCDPFYETIGLVTLEDVIEELIQAEIMDETDVFTDNRSKRRRVDKNKYQDFTMFAERRENQRIHISPQLTLATYQYLSTSLDMFKPTTISEIVLRRLLKQDVFRHVKKNKKQDRMDISTYIYHQGKPVDYFVLILEGRVEVIVGKENLVFEGGPFTYFGIQALAQASGSIITVESPVLASQMGSLQSLNVDALHRFSFNPDYSVRALTDVLYMRVHRHLYLAAKRATLMERSTTDHMDDGDDEDKLLYSLDGDDDGSMGRTTPREMDHDHRHNIANVAQSASPRVHSPTTVIDVVAPPPLDPNGVATFPQVDHDATDDTEVESTTLLKWQLSEQSSQRNHEKS